LRALADVGFDTAKAPTATEGPLVPIVLPRSGAGAFELIDPVAD
jgi:hypothetical protein